MFEVWHTRSRYKIKGGLLSRDAPPPPSKIAWITLRHMYLEPGNLKRSCGQFRVRCLSYNVTRCIVTIECGLSTQVNSIAIIHRREALEYFIWGGASLSFNYLGRCLGVFEGVMFVHTCTTRYNQQK